MIKLFKTRRRARVDDDIDKMIKEDKIEIKKLQAQNREWSRQQNKLRESIDKGWKLDKAGQSEAAIPLYEAGIKYGESATMVKINNYAHFCTRLMIMYRKTKQKEKEVEFISRMIELHPEFNGIDKWKVRLSKLTVK